jgi:Phosphotransferase enzyme family
MPAEDQQEVELTGGTANQGLVVRVGDTVRRPWRPTSESTHALLQHLEDVGFDGAPRLLGVDDRGREVLTYVPGTAISPPYPPWSLTTPALVSVARLLHRYHEAVASFDGDGLLWQLPVPERFTTGLVSHNDPNMDNIVFRDGVAVALIDFDLAAPGSRVWDVAAAARLWAPLRPDVDIADARRGRSLQRLRTFVDAYGLSGEQRELVAEALQPNHTWCYDNVRRHAEAGHVGFATFWSEEGAGLYERVQEWFELSRRAVRDALLA